MGKQYNISLYGNVTNSNGVLSGFVPSNYATTPQAMPDSDTFDIKLKITTGSTAAAQRLFMLGNRGGSENDSYPILVSTDNAGSAIYIKTFSNSTTTEIGHVDIQTNTTYYIRILSNGSTISAYSSQTGFDDMTIIGTPTTAESQGGIFYFGYHPYESSNKGAFQGSIDLNECSISIGSDIWWQGVSINGTTIQLRRDTAVNWESVNPVLAEGEIGIDLTNNKFKIGNGVNTYTSLSYPFGNVGSSSINNIVKLTQVEYDALVQGGTVDASTLYIIA